MEGSKAPSTLVSIALNTVGGQVLDLNNRLVPSGFKIVVGNTVSGNLICEGNDPAPFFDVQVGSNLVLSKALGAVRRTLKRTPCVGDRAMTVYVHKSERVKRQDEIREKLAAGTSIRLA